MIEFDHAYRIAKLLRTKNNVKVYTDWIMVNCPFARKTHSNGRDDNPSFGINWKAGTFNCFSCGKSGRIETLPFMLKEMFPFEDYDWMITLITKGVLKSYKFRVKIDSHSPSELLLRKLPKELLNYFYPLNFTWRGITPEIAADYCVLKSRTNNIIFPIFTIFGDLCGFKGRHKDSGKHFKANKVGGINITDNYFKLAGVWYGEHDLPADRKRIYLVEGERDRILLSEFLIKNGIEKDKVVLCSLGASMPKSQILRLKRVLAQEEIVLLYDDDNAGKRAISRCIKHLKGLYRLLVPKNYFGVKDPAEAVEKGCAADLVSEKNLKEVK